MTIQRKLISAVMSKNVRQLGVHNSATEALIMMKSYSISAILITDDGLILGIITERDIVRAWHKHGDLKNFTCADLMQSPVVFVGHKTRCLDAYHQMTSRGIRHVAVVDDDERVVGMASEGDVMRNFGLEYYMSFKEVASVMATDFVLMAPEATVAHALKMMIDRKQSCVIVADPQKHPIGIMTERDVVRLCQGDTSPEALKLGEVMHGPVMTCRPRKRLHAAVKDMESSRIRRLVVVDANGAACGLLTHHEIAAGLEGDYAKYLREVVELQARHLQESAAAIDEKLLLSNILRSVSGTAVLAADLDYRISYATPSLADVLGLKSSDVGGADLRDTLKRVGWNDAPISLVEAAEGPGAKHYVVATDAGRTEFQVSMLLNARNDPQGYLVLAQRS
jgi:CBS domain-containing protein